MATPETGKPISRETINNILAQTDRKSLFNLSLVSCQWLPECRKALFTNSDITLDSKNTDTFLTLVASPKCTITAHLTKITIDCETNGWKTAYLLQKSKLIFPSVQFLTLHAPHFTTKPACPKLHEIFPNVASLAIMPDSGMDDDEENGIQCVDEYQVAALISSFNASLRTLHIGSDFFGANTRDMGKLARPNLESIHFAKTARGIGLIKWLTPNASVNTAVFLGLYTDQYPSVGKYLAALGPRLKHLRLEAWYPLDEDELEDFEQETPDQHINLSANTELETLHIHCRPDCGTEDLPIIGVKWASALISQITSTSLKKVHFELTFTDFDTLDLIKWNIISDALDSFLSLELVHFEVWCDVPGRDAQEENKERETRLKEYVKGKLVGCVGRGIVDFKFCRADLEDEAIYSEHSSGYLTDEE